MAFITLPRTPFADIFPGTPEHNLTSKESILQSLFHSSPDIPIYTPSNPHHASISAPFSTIQQHQALAIARPTSAAQVADVLTFAKANGLPLGIRSRGHDFSSRAQVTEGLMIDLRAMDQVKISEDKTFALVEPGVSSGRLLEFLDKNGLVTPTGWCNDVSYIGWSLGGGLGILSSSLGLGADHIIGATVVLGDGRIVDTDQHPDLLWALRGSGNGNFGVVVDMRVKLHPSPPLLAGYLSFGSDDAAAVMSRFAQLQDSLPDNFSGEAAFGPSPVGGWAFSLLFAWAVKDGDLDDGRQLVDKLRGFGTVLRDSVTETTAWGFLTQLPTWTQASWQIRCRLVHGFSPALIDILMKHPPAGTYGQLAVVMHNAHGAAIRPNPDSSFPVRKQFRTISLPMVKGGFRDSWPKDIVDAIDDAGIALPESYGNLSPDSDINIFATYGKQAVDRLKAVKRKYDPQNVFNLGYPKGLA